MSGRDSHRHEEDQWGTSCQILPIRYPIEAAWAVMAAESRIATGSRQGDRDDFVPRSAAPGFSGTRGGGQGHGRWDGGPTGAIRSTTSCRRRSATARLTDTSSP